MFLHKQQVVSDEEKQAYVRVLHGNVLTCISTLLKEAADFGYEMDETAQRHAEIVESFDSRQLLTMEVVQSIEYLWLQCPAISATYARRNEFWILDGSEWYFQNCYRFLEEGYRPNEEDMIMARKRTTGVVETQLKYGSVAWSVVDVGGQRSERRKWSHAETRAHAHAHTQTHIRAETQAHACARSPSNVRDCIFIFGLFFSGSTASTTPRASSTRSTSPATAPCCSKIAGTYTQSCRACGVAI